MTIPLTDEEIVSKITSQTSVAISLEIMARCVERFDPANSVRIKHLQETARLFVVHAIKLIAIHRKAVARWMKARGSQAQWVSTEQ